MKSLRIAAAATVLLVMATQAFGYNTSELWRWKSSSLGTAVNRGDPIKVSWSIPDDTAYSAEYVCNNINATLRAKFGANYMNIFSYMFGRMSAVSGLEFIQDTRFIIVDSPQPLGSTTSVSDVRIIGRDLAGPFGWSNMSGNGPTLIQMNTQVGQNWSWYDWINVTMHEIAHSSGLAHGDVYVNSTATSPDLNASVVSLCNSDGPQFDNVYALNRLYGDKLERNGGNDLRLFATDLGNVSAGAKALGTHAGPLRLDQSANDFVSIDGGDDIDFYRFHLDGMSNLSVLVAPKGPDYDFIDDTGRVHFQASMKNNLFFDLYDSTGLALAHVAGAGLGAAESLSQLVAGGDYYVRVAGDRDACQLYRIDVSAEPVVPEPSALGLLGTGVAGVLVSLRRKLQRH